MNHKTLVFSMFVTAVLTVGCATQPVPNAESRLVQEKDVLGKGWFVRKTNTYPVTIKRDSGWMGSACSTRIYVNGKPVADVSTSEKMVIYLREGEHIFSAKPNGICAGGVSELRANVKSDSPLNIRAAYGTNGEFFLNVTAF